MPPQLHFSVRAFLKISYIYCRTPLKTPVYPKVHPEGIPLGKDSLGEFLWKVLKRSFSSIHLFISVNSGLLLNKGCLLN